jgi:hypothetical protein
MNTKIGHSNSMTITVYEIYLMCGISQIWFGIIDAPRLNLAFILATDYLEEAVLAPVHVPGIGNLVGNEEWDMCKWGNGIT